MRRPRYRFESGGADHRHESEATRTHQRRRECTANDVAVTDEEDCPRLGDTRREYTGLTGGTPHASALMHPHEPPTDLLPQPPDHLAAPPIAL